MRISRRRLVLGAALLALAPPATASEPIVAVTTIIEHPALGATRRGLEAGLSEAGLVPGKTLTLIRRSAGGSRAEAARIASEFVALGPDVIVPISTPSAQAVVAKAKDVPVVFAAVSDPVGADLERPGSNVAGVADRLSAADQLDLIQEILPRLAHLGVIHGRHEVAAQRLDALVEEAEARGIVVVRRPVDEPGDVRHAAAALAATVEAFYLPPDPTLIGVVEDLVEAAVRPGVPVFAAEVHAVPRGALAALGFNYFDLGRQAAALVRRVLAGEPTHAIPIEHVRATELYINLNVARRLRLPLPEDVVKRARVAIDAE